MIKQEEVYRIGRLGKPHGVKGEVSFQVSDDVFDRVDADCLVLEIDGILVPFFIEEYRFRSEDIALLKLEGVDTADQARELTGCSVFFLRRLADNDREEVTWAEIIGYRIIDANTLQEVGTLTEVDDSTVNTLFNVTTKEGDEVLLPAGEDLITAVDKAARNITMTIPEGLLDL
ncbi:MAG: 16S rRNA processing protein RimM [Prevotella sp.]|nr:16S rRNA processing protein RimM [Prevotella sp.]